MREDGAERVFEFRLRKRVMNFGVAVVRQSPGSLIDPFVLGAKDESSVQGYVGTPVNINSLTAGYQLPIGAAGAQFPVAGRYYISVDSGRSPFTGPTVGRHVPPALLGQRPARPTIRVLTTRVAAGRPTIAVQILDAGSGVDPFSLVLSYGRVLVGASGYDPSSGVAVSRCRPQRRDFAPAVSASRFSPRTIKRGRTRTATEAT